MGILKLNIYKADNKNEIEKTVTAEGYDLMLGTLQDIMAIIDLDKINIGKINLDTIDSGTEIEIAKMVVRGFNQIVPILRDVFPEVTSEELRRTKTKELIPLFVDLAKEAIGTLAPVKRQGN